LSNYCLILNFVKISNYFDYYYLYSYSFQCKPDIFLTCPGQNATFLTVEWSMSACH